MRLLAITIALLTLSGCSTQYMAARDTAVTAAAHANDRALGAAEFTICRGASVGSVKRKYFTNESKARAWMELCNEDVLEEVLLEAVRNAD